MALENLKAMILAAAESGIGEACAEIQSLAQDMCPVDTGDLKGSIAVSGDGLSGQVSAGSAHAGFVELGTAKMAAQPFLYPAFSAVKGTVAAKIAAHLGG